MGLPSGQVWSLRQFATESVRLRLMLKAHHEVVYKPNQVGGPPTAPLEPSLEPQVEDVVQVQIGEHGANRITLRYAFPVSDDNSVLHHPGPEPLANEPQDYGSAMRWTTIFRNQS